jgi:hypothetical protein
MPSVVKDVVAQWLNPLLDTTLQGSSSGFDLAQGLLK